MLVGMLFLEYVCCCWMMFVGVEFVFGVGNLFDVVVCYGYGLIEVFGCVFCVVYGIGFVDVW